MKNALAPVIVSPKWASKRIMGTMRGYFYTCVHCAGYGSVDCHVCHGTRLISFTQVLYWSQRIAGNPGCTCSACKLSRSQLSA